MADPYAVLGISREAAQEEIRKAYRQLAKASHPDLHPGDKGAEARFKEIAAAYGILGDEKKRARFDSGEIDASGAERQPEREFYRQHAEAGPGFKYERRWHESGSDDADDLFAQIFGQTGGQTGGQTRGQTHAGPKARGFDVGYTMSVEFTEAVNGAKKRVTMADGKTLDIAIPAGLQDGQVLRLRGQGRPGPKGGEPGDALVEVHVTAHPIFRRDGNNIRSVLPITPGEALAGATVQAPTVSGPVQLRVPKGSNTGSILRLRGKGVTSPQGKGDHLLELRVVLPAHPDEELVRSLTEWEAKHPYDPRKQGDQA